MAPSYIQVLNKLKEFGKATSVDIAREFFSDGEKWETVRSSVLNHLKRAEKFRPDVTGRLETGESKSGKNCPMIIFNIENCESFT